jgi:hypothetical protein
MPLFWGWSIGNSGLCVKAKMDHLIEESQFWIKKYQRTLQVRIVVPLSLAVVVDLTKDVVIPSIPEECRHCFTIKNAFW